MKILIFFRNNLNVSVAYWVLKHSPLQDFPVYGSFYDKSFSLCLFHIQCAPPLILVHKGVVNEICLFLALSLGIKGFFWAVSYTKAK